MNIQAVQIMQLAVFILLVYLAYRAKQRWLKITFISLGLVLFLVSPIRFKEDGGVALERGVQRFEDVPDKVLVEELGFKERQEIEMNELKSKTEDMNDEIHN